MRHRRLHLGDRRQLLQRAAQVAVVVDRLGHDGGQHQIARRQAQHVELAAQVLAQAGLRGGHLERAELAVFGPAHRAGALRAPDLAIVGQRLRGFGHHRRRRDRHVGVQRQGFIRALGDFEEGIAPQHVGDHGGEIQRGHLQQPHGMLEARRQCLRLLVLVPEFHCSHL